jgi:hypothetical protein
MDRKAHTGFETGAVPDGVEASLAYSSHADHLVLTDGSYREASDLRETAHEPEVSVATDRRSTA